MGGGRNFLFLYFISSASSLFFFFSFFYRDGFLLQSSQISDIMVFAIDCSHSHVQDAENPHERVKATTAAELSAEHPCRHCECEWTHRPQTGRHIKACKQVRCAGLSSDGLVGCTTNST